MPFSLELLVQEHGPFSSVDRAEDRCVGHDCIKAITVIMTIIMTVSCVKLDKYNSNLVSCVS